MLITAIKTTRQEISVQEPYLDFSECPHWQVIRNYGAKSESDRKSKMTQRKSKE